MSAVFDCRTILDEHNRWNGFVGHTLWADHCKSHNNNNKQIANQPIVSRNPVPPHHSERQGQEMISGVRLFHWQRLMGFILNGRSEWTVEINAMEMSTLIIFVVFVVVCLPGRESKVKSISGIMQINDGTKKFTRISKCQSTWSAACVRGYWIKDEQSEIISRYNERPFNRMSMTFSNADTRTRIHV